MGSKDTGAASGRTGLIGLLCTMAGALTLAFLIPFGTLATCSPARITLFLVLLSASAALELSGIVLGGTSYRRRRDRLALYSVLFALLYAALLVYLLGLAS